MSFLDLKNVTKIYPNGTKAVHETSLSIEEGEFMVFVGPSGCGKSTLLRMVAGLEDITEGEITLDGNLINEVDPSERDIAMVFQNYALYPHMNVYNNLAYGLKNRGIDKKDIEQKVNEAAKLLQISDYLLKENHQCYQVVKDKELQWEELLLEIQKYFYLMSLYQTLMQN